MDDMESSILAKSRAKDLEAFIVLKGQLFFNILSRVEIYIFIYLKLGQYIYYD